jgi:hypothetical protein
VLVPCLSEPVVDAVVAILPGQIALGREVVGGMDVA